MTEKQEEPLTPREGEKVIVFAAGVHIFMGIAKEDDYVGHKEGITLREAYNITSSNTIIPSAVQGGAPKLANNISITPPPAANLDLDVTTVKLWVGIMSWAYTPTAKAVEAVRWALKNQALAKDKNA